MPGETNYSGRAGGFAASTGDDAPCGNQAHSLAVSVTAVKTIAPGGPAPDTIAAIATAPGAAAVAIVRISGPLSLAVLTRLFKPANPAFTSFNPRVLHYGRIITPAATPNQAPNPTPDAACAAPAHYAAAPSSGQILDEVLAVFMPGPGTFTGEDTVEIQGHGGPAVSAAVLKAVLDAGARLAEPGEFTRRAFLNGRMDLSQAEAVAECITARSAEALLFAQAKLDGRLGQRIQKLRKRLRGLITQLTVAVDFPEEDVEILPRQALALEVAALHKACTELTAGYERARLMRQGALVVLAGQVNVGKSSLLNALLGRERAIVTPYPGTTRDFLEESLDLAGLPARLVDTAGLRTAHDPVEEEGLRRARELMAQADLVLWVTDVEHNPTDPDQAVEAAELSTLAPGKVLGVLNKIDLRTLPRESFDPLFPANTPAPGQNAPNQDFPDAPGWLAVSARTGAGIENLAAAIRARLLESRSGETAPEDTPVPNLRQQHILVRAQEELAGLAADLEGGMPYDILGVRAETTSAILAEITGEIATDDVLDLIFSEFCLGK